MNNSGFPGTDLVLEQSPVSWEAPWFWANQGGWSPTCEKWTPWPCFSGQRALEEGEVDYSEETTCEVQSYKIFFFTIEIMGESLFLSYLATSLWERSWSHCRIKIWPEADLLTVKWLPHLWKLPPLVEVFAPESWSHSKFWATWVIRIFCCKITFKPSSAINLQHRHINGQFYCVKAIFIPFVLQ